MPECSGKKREARMFQERRKLEENFELWADQFALNEIFFLYL